MTTSLLISGAESGVWGVFDLVAQLPNKSGADIQDSGLRVGHLALVNVAGTPTVYHCTLATLGAATWDDHPTKASVTAAQADATTAIAAAATAQTQANTGVTNAATAQAAVDVLELLHAGVVPNIITNIPIGDTAYGSIGTDSFGVATETYITDIELEDGLVTALGYLKGTVVGTDKVCLILYDGAGVVLGQTLGDGTTVSAGADAFQEVDLVTPVTAVKGKHYVGLQINGTTAKLRLMAANTYLRFTSKITGETFGTATALTPPTGFTATVGPVCYAKAAAAA